jgi:hypothetical protein
LTDQAAPVAHHERLGFSALSVTPDPVRIATEGASTFAGARMWENVWALKFLRMPSC